MTETSSSSATKPIVIGVVTAVLLTVAFNAGIQYANNSSPKPAAQNPTSSPDVSSSPQSASVATAAAAADPYIVSIYLNSIDPSKKQAMNLNLPMMQGQESRNVMERKAVGSGIILEDNGYIVTSSHVLRPGYDIKVTLNDKRQFPAKLVGKDAFMDLAVLKIEATGLPVAKFGDDEHLRIGDWAIAVGSPYGFEHSVTLGIISGPKRSLPEINNNMEMIQHDAPLNPGNSGGPLLNARGEVIGINTAIRKMSQNLSFAMPGSQAKTIAAELKEHGSIARPYLGINMSDIDALQSKSMGYADMNGVIVAFVVPNSPSEKAGLEKNDLIEKVDGVAVSSQVDVRKIIHKHKPDDAVIFSVARKDGHEDRKVKLGTYPESFGY